MDRRGVARIPDASMVYTEDGNMAEIHLVGVLHLVVATVFYPQSLEGCFAVCSCKDHHQEQAR